MTTNYHTPLSGADLPLALISWNTRLSDLDSAISNVSSTTNTVNATLGESVSIRQAGYIDPSDGQGYLLDADSATPKSGAIRGFWTTTASAAATGILQISGALDGFTGLTSGEPVYVSSTAGTLTQTRPSPTSAGSQIAIMEMGIALSATEVLVKPLPVQYQKRDAMADTETLTINHHGDDNGYLRKVYAYITETIAGAEAEGYADSNQDVDVALRDRAPSTYGSDECSGGTAIGDMVNNVSGSGGVAAAFDDNAGTDSYKVGLAGIIGYDFGAANDKTIRQYTLQEATSIAETIMVRDWTFQYSDNNVDWTTADTVTGETSWSDGEKRTFQIANVGAHRYWRVNASSNNGHGATIGVGECEMMEAATYDDGDDKLAQTFTLSGSTDIGGVGLWLKKVGSPTGTATVRIETVSASNPTGTLADVAATIDFDESDLGASYAEKLLTFASEFTLGAGTYAIVLSTDRSVSESNYLHWGADGSSPSYSGGDMRSEISSTWSAESKDAVFGVYEPGASHPSRVSVDWWSSSYADMVNRYGDGAGASLDSQTTFKCVRTAGFDDITVVVELP